MARLRPVLVDAVVALAVFAVLVGATIANPAAADEHPLDITGYTMLIGIAVVTFFRRRWPIAVLVVSTAGIFIYYALGFPAVGLELPLAAPVFTVAAVGRWRFAAVWSVAVTLFAYLTRIRLGQDPIFLLGLQFPTTVAVLAGAVALGDAMHSRRELRHEQERSLAAVRSEAEQRTAQRLAAERVQLARDLHDVLGHTVSVVSLHADVAEEAIAAGDARAADEAVRAIREASGAAMRDLRGTVQVLRGNGPATLDPVGGVAAVPMLVDRARAAGIDVTTSIDVDPAAVPATAGMTAYRVVQEALTNVLRHAGAERAWVRVTSEPGALVVQVDDDGRGMPADAGLRGSGVRGMAERVQLVGGSLRTGSRADGSGTSVSARIPT